jgi:fatty acid desaturase
LIGGAWLNDIRIAFSGLFLMRGKQKSTSQPTMNESAETPERLSVPKSLYRLRPMIWIADLVLDWSIIVAVFWLFSLVKSWWLVPLAGLIIGARLHALGLLAHEGTHGLAFSNKRLNDWLTELLTAWPLFVAIDHGYRPWHFNHHRHLGTEQDPELGAYRGHEPYASPVSWRKVRWFFMGDLLGLGTLGLIKFMIAVFPRTKPWRMLYPAVLWACFFLICYQLDALWVAGLWTWSVVVGFWAVFRVRTWTEHVGLPMEGKETSHRFEPGLLGRFLFFPHNTFCHYEHHKWPQVPYYNLPKVREIDQGKPVMKLSGLFPATL